MPSACEINSYNQYITNQYYEKLDKCMVACLMRFTLAYPLHTIIVATLVKCPFLYPYCVCIVFNAVCCVSVYILAPAGVPHVIFREP